jgi:cytochrome c peroxidase
MGTPVNLSCADCHLPSAGGADRTSVPNEFSIGAGWFNVNAPSVINSAYWDLYFWNGRADNLWAVTIAATEAAWAYNGTRLAVMDRLRKNYQQPYLALTGEQLPTGDWPATGKPGQPEFRVFTNYAKAIAAYETTLIIKSSPFDEYLDGEPAMTDEAIRGAKLFIGKAGCIECHSGPLFSDRDFHNIGVPENEARPKEADCIDSACDCTDEDSGSCYPWGAFDGFKRLANNRWLRTSTWSSDPTDDSRAHHLARDITELKGAWRTPSLRNLRETAPYMHNGVYRTLEEVIWHYDQGGTSSGSASENKGPEMQALFLDQREVQDLVAFLDALNGEPLPKGVTMP